MKKTSTFLAVTVFVSACAGFFASALLARAGFFDDLFQTFTNPQAEISSPQSGMPLYRPVADYEEAVVSAVERAAPAVISIVITKDLPVIENCPFNPFGDLPPEFQRFFGPNEFQRPCQRGTKRQEVGGGSGFIVSKDGLILTNKHVVADESASYTVLLNDGTKLSAKVLARDPAQDLAIIKIKTDYDLPVLIFGDSDSVKLGQTAIAIGNALGEFRNTVSVGIVSGLARSIEAGSRGEIEHLEGLIQTDAAINPGNSGGPLLNLRGEVIAINTAIAAGAANIGFAIPINSAKRDIESVSRTGKIQVPYLGVRYIILSEDIAKRDGLSVNYGALIRGDGDDPAVILGSPAAKAGLRAEDIILSVNGEKITTNRSLSSFIQSYAVGEALRLTILRDGKEMTVRVTLGERQS